MRYSYVVYRKKEYANLIELYNRVRHYYGYNDETVFVFTKDYTKVITYDELSMGIADVSNIYDSDIIRKPFIFSSAYKYYDCVYSNMKNTKPHKTYSNMQEFFIYVADIIRKKRNRKEIAEMLE
jgi:hypothetical protein